MDTRTQMEVLAAAVQLAVNWSIDDVNDETSVVITVKEYVGDGHLYWYLADSHGWEAATTPEDLLITAAEWVQKRNEANRQRKEDERLGTLVEP